MFLAEPNFVILDKATSEPEYSPKRLRKEGKRKSQGLSILLAMLKAIPLDSEQVDGESLVDQSKVAGLVRPAGSAESAELSNVLADLSTAALIPGGDDSSNIQDHHEGEMVKDFL